MKTPRIDQNSLLREKALYRYSGALERGDFETVATVLEQAEKDPELERMIMELNAAYTIEGEAVSVVEAGEVVRGLLREHLPSAFTSAEDVTDQPLTVSDVAARLQADAARDGRSDRELSVIGRRLAQSNDPLPPTLSERWIGRLFDEIGVEASKRFQKLFRDTAIFLSMGREQGMTRLAATRKQQHIHEQHVDETRQDEEERP